MSEGDGIEEKRKSAKSDEKTILAVLVIPDFQRA